MNKHGFSGKLRRMNLLFLLVIGAVYAMQQARAQPVVLEETIRLPSPEPYTFDSSVALQGKDLLVTAVNEGDYEGYYGLFHFELQADGTWLSRGLVATHRQGWTYFPNVVALDSGVAVFASDAGNITVLERTPTGWITTPLTLPTDTRPGILDLTSGVRVVDGTLAISASQGGLSLVFLVRKNAAGAWVVTDVLEGAPALDDTDYLGPAIEFVGTQATAANYYEDYSMDPSPQYVTHVFDFIGGSWQRTEILPRLLGAVPMDGEIALRTGSDRERGEILFLDRRDTAGAWTVRNVFTSEESFANVEPGPMVVRGDRAYAGVPHNDLRGENSGSANVFDRDSQGRFNHVATLVGSDAMTAVAHTGLPAGQYLGRTIAVDGLRVATVGYTTPRPENEHNTALYIYDLPASLPLAKRVQDTFEDRNAAGWTPWGEARWSVVSTGGSFVYRQTNTTAGARAILDAPYSENQAIEADLTVRELSGASSWAGLMVRYVDSMNYYYLLVGRDGTIQIRRNFNGVFGPIASAPFDLRIGRNYRLRLEAVGTWLRAFVDGRLVLQTRDAAHTEGRAALTMWKTRADYDNVVVSTSPQTELLSDTFSQDDDYIQREEESYSPWDLTPASAWSYVTASGGATVLQQSAIEGGQRAVNGAPAADQIVAADVRITSFHPYGTGWAGLMARHQDELNYYYAYIRDTDVVSLRKFVNGKVVVLDEAPMTVSAGNTYRMRLEAIGNSLRVYVNGKLMAEAEDSDYPMGRYGLATYRAAVQYDTFSAARP